jgi:hypothetical protein
MKPTEPSSPVMRADLLQIYLNDHLAGATAGLELAKRTLSENRGAPFEPMLARIAEDIGEDREALRELMIRWGVRIRPWKTAAAWAVERVARLKLNGAVRGYSPLSRLLEVETLLLGVQGKASMWRGLLALADQDPRFESTRLLALLGRAEAQLASLESLRVSASAAAFLK